MGRTVLGIVLTCSCVAMVVLVFGKASDRAGRRPWHDLSRLGDTPQPTRGSGHPVGRRYCLLVFGPDAKSRVWLTLDGDTLYVTRNAAGSGLVENGEGITQDKGEALCTYHAGDIARPEYTDLRVTTHGDNAWVSVCWNGGRVLTAHSDSRGPLRFAGRPADAPVVHFGGPLSMRLAYQPSGQLTLRTGEKGTELFVGVGTLGIGAGTFAFLDYAAIPTNLSPVVDIEFPSGTSGQPPPHTRVRLSHRC